MTNRATVEIIIILLCVAWCAGIFAAPLLERAGDPGTSAVVYEFYGRVCHQIDNHSWHIAGAKFGVCARCTSIYVSFTVGTLVWMLIPRRVPARPRRGLLFIAAGLMLLDVVLNTLGVHASSSLTRAITGSALGVVLPWIVLPVLLEAIDQLRRGRLRTAHPPAGDTPYV